MTIHLNKLRYHSWHRGTKELDQILGTFFDGYGASMTNEQLLLYEKFLQEDDYQIYNWLMGLENIEATYHVLVKQIIRECCHEVLSHCAKQRI